MLAAMKPRLLELVLENHQCGQAISCEKFDRGSCLNSAIETLHIASAT